MKFCSKCGKELMDEAVICPGCGCATNQTSFTQQPEKSPIIRTGYGKMLVVAIIMGLPLGFVVGSLSGQQYLEGFITAFLIGTVIASLVCFGALALFCSVVEKTTVQTARKALASQGKIYFEGSANHAGNGGWLFVTSSAIEFRAHKVNLDSKSITLAYADVISIKKAKKKLAVQTNNGTYEFIVESLDKWITLLSNCEATKEKVSSL